MWLTGCTPVKLHIPPTSPLLGWLNSWLDSSGWRLVQFYWLVANTLWIKENIVYISAHDCMLDPSRTWWCVVKSSEHATSYQDLSKVAVDCLWRRIVRVHPAGVNSTVIDGNIKLAREQLIWTQLLPEDTERRNHRNHGIMWLSQVSKEVLWC